MSGQPFGNGVSATTTGSTRRNVRDFGYLFVKQFRAIVKSAVVNDLFSKNQKKRRNALSKCKLVKFRKVSDIVWVSLEAVVVEKTIKEE